MPVTGVEPADATFDVAVWQGEARPPLDPLGFRAGVGATEGGGCLRNLVPIRAPDRPAGGRRSGNWPSRRTRRPRSCAHRRGISWGSRGRSPSPAPLFPQQVCWLMTPNGVRNQPWPAQRIGPRRLATTGCDRGPGATLTGQVRRPVVHQPAALKDECNGVTRRIVFLFPLWPVWPVTQDDLTLPAAAGGALPAVRPTTGRSKRSRISMPGTSHPSGQRCRGSPRKPETG